MRLSVSPLHSRFPQRCFTRKIRRRHQNNLICSRRYSIAALVLIAAGARAAVAGVSSQPFVFYYGATGGGVWKTTDGGINWESVSDGSVFGTGSVGAIAVADSDPNMIYVGMGESPIRGNVSHGDGVYKSNDAR